MEENNVGFSADFHVGNDITSACIMVSRLTQGKFKKAFKKTL